MDEEHIARQGKPPRKGQFKPGESGNPKGRPKGTKSLKTHILDQLMRKVVVVEHGQRRQVTRAEAIAIQLVNKAASGDPKGLAAILHATRQFDEAAADASQAVLAYAEDQLVMQGIIERIREAGEAEQAIGNRDEREATSAGPEGAPS